MALKEDLVSLMAKYNLTKAQLIQILSWTPPEIRIPHIELVLARANGCFVLGFPFELAREWSENAIMYKLDLMGGIRQIGSQHPDSPSGLHEQPDKFQVLWIDLNYLVKTKEILKSFPEAKIFT